MVLVHIRHAWEGGKDEGEVGGGICDDKWDGVIMYT